MQPGLQGGSVMGEGGIRMGVMSRRRFLAASAATAGAVAGLGISQCDPYMVRKLQQAKDGVYLHHTVWVWQFSSDGGLEALAGQLHGTNVGVVIKTHDGTDWMSKYDHHSDAITGASRASNVGRFFEDRGIPYHAWCVVKGIDPEREAEMCADILAGGARSMVLDLEGASGFWVGSPSDALRFGDRLRTLSPYGRVDISIDPRPWRINLAPMAAFVGLSDGIWPQLYWDTFNTPGNHDGYRAAGFPLPPEGTTPEFLLDATAQILAPYNRPIIPIGQGAASNPETWPRFAHRAWELGQYEVSVWRLGVTRGETVGYLSGNPPGPEPVAPPATPTPTPSAKTATPTKTAKPTKTSTPSPAPSWTPNATSTSTPAASTATATPTLPPTATPTP
jgi:hypothetical protein